ncbi:tripartite tricarboxylate transporter permease [Geminicoccaceae bacterium 1502E]|nr:tripartite tricarboxylate transporter permease [Geminicoccaceae bacterium 1502E]
MPLADIAAGLAMVADPWVLTVILLSAFFGLFIGAVPGLTATMATALLVPVTFFMDPLPAVAAIVACTAMAITAGDIPGALLRIPGTPASAAYTDEAYALTRAGRPEIALGSSLLAAVAGGLFGSIVLMLAAPALARVALGFSSFEYFWLALLGLSCATFLGAVDRLKALASLAIGMLISTVGMDTMTGLPRFTMGSVELMGGISFIPAMIGMFALSEVLRGILWPDRVPRVTVRIGSPLRGIGRVLASCRVNLARGSVIGTTVGILPGVGGDLAAWICYATARRFSRTPEKFGTGHPEGLVEAGAANNSGLGGAWVPALVFGIPGDAVTAIAIGVLYMKGLNPGPRLFVEQAPMLYAVFACFLVANLLLIPLGLLAIRAARRLLAVPRPQLVAAVLVFSIVGSFAINNSVFGVAVMLAMGLLAFLLESARFPVAPIILGIVLGPLVEQNFMTSMTIADGSLPGFFARPVAGVLGVVTILVWLTPVLGALLRRRGGEASSGAGS